MNLSSLSSQLNISIQDLRLKAKDKGYFISPKANKVDNYVARKLIEAYGKITTTGYIVIGVVNNAIPDNWEPIK